MFTLTANFYKIVGASWHSALSRILRPSMSLYNNVFQYTQNIKMVAYFQGSGIGSFCSLCKFYLNF